MAFFHPMGIARLVKADKPAVETPIASVDRQLAAIAEVPPSERTPKTQVHLDRLLEMRTVLVGMALAETERAA